MFRINNLRTVSKLFNFSIWDPCNQDFTFRFEQSLILDEKKVLNPIKIVR